MTDRIPKSVIEAMALKLSQYFNVHADGCRDIVLEQLRAAEAHDPPFKLIGREPTEKMTRKALWAERMHNPLMAAWDAAPKVDE